MADLARGFDRLSPVYDPLAGLCSLGAIGRSQRALLGRVTTAGPVLIVGGGSGRFLDAWLAGGRRGSVTYLELSARMLDRARRRTARRREDVTFVLGDVRDLEAEAAYELICTPYVLDVFPPVILADVMRRLDRALVPGGRWLCADFTEPRGARPRRAFQRALHRGLYAFFGKVAGLEARSLPPIERCFAERGYTVEARRELAMGLLWTALYRKPERRGQPSRSRVTADSEAQPQSAIATSNSWRNSDSTRSTPA